MKKIKLAMAAPEEEYSRFHLVEYYDDSPKTWSNYKKSWDYIGCKVCNTKEEFKSFKEFTKKELKMSGGPGFFDEHFRWNWDHIQVYRKYTKEDNYTIYTQQFAEVPEDVMDAVRCHNFNNARPWIRRINGPS